MKVIGLRYCMVSDDAEVLSGFLENEMALPSINPFPDSDKFGGSLVPAGDSLVEIWPTGEGMPAMTMLQIEVDDAGEWAKLARSNGCEVQGPTMAHGEEIYYVTAPSGMPISVQSKQDVE